MIDQTLVSGIAKAVIDLRNRGGSTYYFRDKSGTADGEHIDVQGVENAVVLGLVMKDAHRTRTLYMLTRLGWSLDNPQAAEREVRKRLEMQDHEVLISDQNPS